MKTAIARVLEWIRDPFDKQQLNKHDEVLNNMQRTIVLTQETKTTLTDMPANRFPVGHMIGRVQKNPAQKRSSRRT